jgi:hypothetical protein
MPDLGPMGRGGARRRTRRRMNMMQSMDQQGEDQPAEDPQQISENDESMNKLFKLAKLLKDKGVISESEYNLIFD